MVKNVIGLKAQEKRILKQKSTYHFEEYSE
jgi:hypothetical protein